jgi:amidohydrolase
MKILVTSILFSCAIGAFAQLDALKKQIVIEADAIEKQMIEWRRDFHEHPELGNREFRTSKIIVAHLKSLGLEVKENVAKTGVVALLKGDKTGPCIALRADIDGLPVIERTPVLFASKEKTKYNGLDVGIMHACGHDTHISILMATASVLSKHKKDIKGTVKFIFQPAEEGAPEGEEGGAALMVKEGVLDNPKVESIFGLHINSQTPVNTIEYKPEGMMASACDFKMVVKGKQSHGAKPWNGVDPIVISSTIINAWQTIVSRNLDITKNPSVITVGSIHSGVRFNIIPEQAELTGTVRALSKEDENTMYTKMKDMAKAIAESMGATVDIILPNTTYYPVTFNNVALINKSLPSLQAAAGKENVSIMPPSTGAEDFSFFANKVPGFFFNLGGMEKGKTEAQVAGHHTPDFYIDESGMKLGVKAFCFVVLDYLK